MLFGEHWAFEAHGCCWFFFFYCLALHLVPFCKHLITVLNQIGTRSFGWTITYASAKERGSLFFIYFFLLEEIRLQTGHNIHICRLCCVLNLSYTHIHICVKKKTFCKRSSTMTTAKEALSQMQVTVSQWTTARASTLLVMSPPQSVPYGGWCYWPWTQSGKLGLVQRCRKFVVANYQMPICSAAWKSYV